MDGPVVRPSQYLESLKDLDFERYLIFVGFRRSRQ